jgi:ATP-dependent helicase/nuclease subunit B
LAAPEGTPLVLLAPRQGTYQLEQQLLAEPSLAGYTRLRIVSFEGLARFVLEQLQAPRPKLLDEEGRLMVLRALLAKKRGTLKLFRASARLTGFAQHLSGLLREVQAAQLTPAGLRQVAAAMTANQELAFKLQDLATLLEEYLAWLTAHQLRDSECLLQDAAEALNRNAPERGHSCPQQAPSTQRSTKEAGPVLSYAAADKNVRAPASQGTGDSPKRKTRKDRQGDDTLQLELFRQRFRLQHLWVDGFAEYSTHELDLLSALLPYCELATMTFCVEETGTPSWLSHWAVVRKTLDNCRKRFAEVGTVELQLETLNRSAGFSLQQACQTTGPDISGVSLVPGETFCRQKPALRVHATRFSANPALQHLEQHWAESVPCSGPVPEETIRLFVCNDPEAEGAVAARQILRYVRGGGRYRDISVILRSLEGYHQPLSRVFARYGIPFFLDRREAIAHHPLSELTRSALRTLALGWQHDDWFSALKSGLVPIQEGDIDRLENEALARGWRGAAWRQPLRIRQQPRSPEEGEALARREAQLESMRRRLIPPFEQLALRFKQSSDRPTGAQLAEALLEFWEALDVRNRLEEWAQSAAAEPGHAVIHETVWTEMNQWLANLELAFASDALSLRDWLPIVEAGLSSLTVGVIPPALDQVLVGAVERSRTPEVNLVLVLGMNETVFPARPATANLLTEDERNELQKLNVPLGASYREQLSRERYLGYIACTRASERLVLTCARRDSDGALLNPSPFIEQVRRTFPSLLLESALETVGLADCEHACEARAHLVKMRAWPDANGEARDWSSAGLPGVWDLSEAPRQLNVGGERLSPELAAQLYGPVLRSSVSRLEQFAACPFKFFVHSGLRAEERKTFELDAREQGSFQHDVLARFHEQLQSEKKRWRDISPAQARERIERIAQSLTAEYREGLLESSEQTRFMARVMTESLQDFVETMIEWSRTQYRFDPVAVELPFGLGDGVPLWVLKLPGGGSIEVNGRIDRIDVFHERASGETFCVVLDYKSSQKQLDSVLVAHGLQLQLLTYLQVLLHWRNPSERFGARRLKPAGVFYVNLRGQYEIEQNRQAALADPSQLRKMAYRHSGRFDKRVLPWLDDRSGALQGDQFNYRITLKGEVNKNSREALGTADFKALLASVEASLEHMGEEIYAGSAQVAPYRKGLTTACGLCEYQSICRIDPWTHRYRVLKAKSKDEG